MRSIAALWDYLPAFRAVAEAEHLGRAALLLGSSPPALSRAVALLEAKLGEPLFIRGGRGMKLNPRGRRLLDAVRDAMRLVDDGIGPSRSRAPRLAVAPLLRGTFPRAVVVAADPQHALRSGRADVVLWLDVCAVAGLEGSAIAELRLTQEGRLVAEVVVHAWHRKHLGGERDPNLDLIVSAARRLRGET